MRCGMSVLTTDDGPQTHQAHEPPGMLWHLAGTLSASLRYPHRLRQVFSCQKTLRNCFGMRGGHAAWPKEQDRRSSFRRERVRLGEGMWSILIFWLRYDHD